MNNNKEYPYGCVELKQSDLHGTFIEWFYSFKKKDVIEKSKEIFEHIKDNTSDKKGRIWALLGGEKGDKWICLQVASSSDIKKEIISDIKCMMPLTEKDNKLWSSVFHSDIFEVQYGQDVRCQKYRNMYERFEFFCIIVINPEEYIKESNIEKFPLVKYAEVKFAYDKKALYWNPIKEEWAILKNILKNEN